ncbi:MAG: SDR family oxidoreductase, partial [Candidatus Aminicenantales bacterium]
SYYGGEKVVPGYNVMGVAKAALESTARYLAWSSISRKGSNLPFVTFSAKHWPHGRSGYRK